MSLRVPEEYICPITNEIMVDPVIDPDGNSYEREAIMDWLRRQQTSPITRHLLLPTQLAPNRALKNIIETFKHNHRGQLDDYVADSKDARDSRDVKGPGAKHADERKAPEEAKADAKTTNDETHVKPIMLYAVIDTSGSMQEPCGGNGSEDDGYSRLDLVKHTLNTLVTALSDADYACVIKFSTVADVFIPLTQLTDNNKKLLIEKLKHLEPENQTNLWDGIRLAIDEISTLRETTVNDYNIQVYVLTDGESNINPPGVLSNVIKSHLDRKCSHLRNYPVINTFGYGYNLDSDMLFSISKVSNGFFGFIPDATMVGTVFINALSNSIIIEKPRLDDISQSVCNQFIDILNQILTAREYDNRFFLLTQFNTFLDQADHRAEHLGGHLPTIDFIYNVKSDCSSSHDPNLGQVSKAIEQKYFNQWGKHYLRSLLSAYINRVCINFKDKGIQVFKTPRFIDEQKRIESIFVQLPPPRPSGRVMSNYRNNYTVGGGYSSRNSSPPLPPNMANYYDADGGCFSDDSLVYAMIDGKKVMVPVNELKKDSLVLSFDGVTTVDVIVKIKFSGCLYQIGEMKLTSHHPIMMKGKEYFPCSHPFMKKIKDYDGYVYDVVLRNRSILAAVYNREDVKDDGFYVATYGHNVKSELFSHDYFGSDLIVKDLQATKMWSEGYIVSEKPVYHRDNESFKVVRITW